MFEINSNSRPHNWLIHHLCIKSIRRNLKYLAGGNVLDVGCGRKPYYDLIKSVCKSYCGLDIYSSRASNRADIYGDAMQLPFASGVFDSIVSFQVLEHIPEPDHFMKEAFRVLKSGGYALITTPFIWAEHDQPHDYYRFTRYGMKYISEKSGFIVVDINPDTGTLTSVAFRITYWLDHFPFGVFRKLLYPIYVIIQIFAFVVDKIDRSYKVDSSTYTTVLRKP